MTLTAKIGRRGAALLFFVLLDVVNCVALLTAPRPLVPLYAWMNEVMPLPIWAGAWGIVALICLWYAFRVYDTPAFNSAVGLKVGWGLLSLFGWLWGEVDRGWVSSIIWLAFAAFVFLIAGGIPAAPPRPVRRNRPWIRSSV